MMEERRALTEVFVPLCVCDLNRVARMQYFLSVGTERRVAETCYGNVSTPTP